jgi:dipeptidyl aminopeptidase/acylaminoacyl peptidase
MNPGKHVVFSPDGKSLATSGTDNIIRIWDTVTGKERFPAHGHQAEVSSVFFLPDQQTILTTGWDNTVRLWDAESGRESRRFPDQGSALAAAALSPDRKTLATDAVYDDAAHLWDICSVKAVRQLPGHQRYAACLAFSADGQLLATGDEQGTIRVWPVVGDRKPLQVMGRPFRPLRSLAFSPDGTMLATCGWDRMLRLWNVAAGEVRREWAVEGDPTMVLSPDGKNMATVDRGGEKVSLWEVGTGKERLRFAGHKYGNFSVAFSPDGMSLATGAWDGSVHVWDLLTAQESAVFRGHHDFVTCLDFSADGKRLASGSRDTTVLVWDSAGRAAALPPRPRLKPAELERLWKDLGSEAAAVAYHSLRDLLAVPDQSVPFLRKQLSPAAPFDAARVRSLMDDLDKDDFAVREAATRALERLGERVRPLLSKRLRTQPTPEMRKRIEGLLERLATAVAPTEELRELRAIEILEHCGMPSAKEVLERLAAGAKDASLTREAAASLRRLAQP